VLGPGMSVADNFKSEFQNPQRPRLQFSSFGVFEFVSEFSDFEFRNS
jgi:hypothetical protein